MQLIPAMCHVPCGSSEEQPTEAWPLPSGPTGAYEFLSKPSQVKCITIIYSRGNHRMDHQSQVNRIQEEEKLVN